jgi:lysophospholipase L1-like esterase
MFLERFAGVKIRFAAILLASFCSYALVGCGVSLPSLAPIHVPLTNNAVFIGDSITYLWSEDPGFQAHANWIDKGISGQSSYLVALRFETDVIALRPKAVHIIVGTNDVYPGWEPCVAPEIGIPFPGDTCANIVYMVQTAERYGIKVVLGTIPPWGCYDDPHCGLSVADETPSRYARIAALNDFLKAYGKMQNVTVVDYHTLLEDPTGLHYAQGLTQDGVHPSPQGFQLMTSAVTPTVD